MRFATVAATFAMAGVLAFGPMSAVAGAQSACARFGGIEGPDQTCTAYTAGAGYTVDLSFPTDYPDAPPLADYLAEIRDDFVDLAAPWTGRRTPSLTALFTEYEAGGPDFGTRSVVLDIRQDATQLPVAWFKAFNYDLGRGAPLTLDTLFAPGITPRDAVYPAVVRQLQRRWQPEELASMLGEVDDHTFEEFAVTDDAVIFFFGQGRLLPHPEGPQHVVVPRTDLPPLRV